MFSWDLMILLRSSSFLGTKVAADGPDSRMVFETFPFIFPICDGIFSLEGTSKR